MVYIQSNGLQLPVGDSKPKHSIYVAGPKVELQVVVNDASTKTGDIVLPTVGTYSNGVADVAANTVSGFAAMEIKAAGTNAGGVSYKADYTFEDGEEATALLLSPGLVFWARCAENGANIAIGTDLVSDTGGLVKIRAAVTTGQDLFRSLQPRTASGTESWIMIQYMGKAPGA